jgi:hypothetical protein
MATLDEAQVCPRCDKTGELGGTRAHPSKPGHKLVEAYCRNPLCPWLDTPWVIMILPDGSVPDPAPPGVARGEKVYGDPLTGEGKAQAAGISTAMIEKINAQVARLQQGTYGGGEV